MAVKKQQPFLLFSGSSHEGLAKEIARVLKVPLGKAQVGPFPDGEVGVQILENVRGQEVFVVQSAVRRPNHYLMELLLMVDALKRASAKGIVAVMPYYPYSRQDRKEKGRVPISAKLVADLIEKAGATRVLTIDLHTEQIQGFFNIPVDNLYARRLFVEAFRKMGLKQAVVVSPDVGSSRMARKFAEDLHCEIALVDKRRLNSETVESLGLVGDVRGKEVILVDDICSTGSTLTTAAKLCREKGAKKVFAAVTHGLFVGEKRISGVDACWVTDAVPLPKKEIGVPLRSVSVAPLLGQAIRCIVEAKSISSLFGKKGT